MDLEPNPKFFTAPADTARTMHAAEMRGQDMPDHVFVAYIKPSGHVAAFTRPRNKGHVKFTRTDLCITEAECQHRIDAAVVAEREAWYAAISQQFGNLMAIHTKVKAAAIRARGQK